MSLILDHGRPAGWAAEARATLALGWPIILTNLAQIAITTTEVMILGRIGPQALAAGALGANTFFAVFIFGLGLALATAPMLAQALGRRRHSVREGRRIVRQGMWVSLAYAVPGWVLLWQAEPLLLALGQQPELAAAAGAYVRALQWGLLPALWFMVLRSFIAALERPKAALAVTAAAIAVNAVACWGLALGRFGLPALGVTGAGIAGSLSNGFMFAALLATVLIDRRFRRYRLLGHWWRPDWPKLAELLRIGGPMSLSMGFEVTVFNCAVFVMGLIGTAALAAHSVAIQLASITFMVPLGLGQAATVRVGLAAGAGDAAGVGRAGWVALGLGASFMAATAATMLLAPTPLVALFVDGADPAARPVADLAAAYLTVAGVFQVVDGIQSVGAGALRGLKDTRVPMVFAGLGYWGIGMPLGVALGFGAGWGGVGIWIGLAAGLAVVAALMLARWSRRVRLGLVAAPP